MGNSEDIIEVPPDQQDEATAQEEDAESPPVDAEDGGLRSISKAIGEVALWRLGFDKADEYADRTEVGEEARPETVRARRAWPWWLFPVLALFSVLAAGAITFAGLVMLSTASVDISTRTDEVEAPGLIVASLSPSDAVQNEQVDGLTLSGAEAIPAKLVEMVISESGRTPVFGSKMVPDQTAGGSVRLTNPFPTPQSVPAWTLVGVVNGVAFYTVEDVMIPAGDPYGSLSYGWADVRVVAGQPGSVGNIPSGSLVGQLQNGIYILNEEGIGGGTDKSIPVVSEEDRLVLRQQLEEKIRGAALSSLQAKVEPGQQLIVSSLAFGDWQEEYDQPVGAEAAEVGLVLKSRITALSFSDSDVDQAAARLVERALSKRDTGAAKRTVESVSHSKVQLMRVDPEKAILQMEVGAVVHYGLDQGSLSKIRSDIAGKPVVEANAYLAALPYIESFDMQREPEWLPWDRLPTSPDRISVRVEE